MTEETFSAICPDCQKEFPTTRGLRMHRTLHCKGAAASIEQPQPKQPEPQPFEQTEQPSEKPDPLGALKVFGIEPEQFMATLSPLIEKSVVQTLEKMQIAEVINKRMADIETKLGQQVAGIADAVKPALAPQGDNQPAQNTQLRDTVLGLLAQKLVGGNSTGSLESLTKVLEMARAVSDTFNKPVLEAQAYTRREISDTLKLLRDAGASPDAARDIVIKRTEG